MTLPDLLGQKRDAITLAERHDAYNVRVFGSLARGEARPDRDIDFLVEFKPGCGLIDRIALTQDLQDLPGRSVDVARERSLRKRSGENALKDAVSL